MYHQAWLVRFEILGNTSLLTTSKELHFLASSCWSNKKKSMQPFSFSFGGQEDEACKKLQRTGYTIGLTSKRVLRLQPEQVCIFVGKGCILRKTKRAQEVDVNAEGVHRGVCRNWQWESHYPPCTLDSEHRDSIHGGGETRTPGVLSQRDSLQEWSFPRGTIPKHGDIVREVQTPYLSLLGGR